MPFFCGSTRRRPARRLKLSCTSFATAETRCLRRPVPTRSCSGGSWCEANPAGPAMKEDEPRWPRAPPPALPRWRIRPSRQRGGSGRCRQRQLPRHGGRRAEFLGQTFNREHQGWLLGGGDDSMKMHGRRTGLAQTLEAMDCFTWYDGDTLKMRVGASVRRRILCAIVARFLIDVAASSGSIRAQFTFSHCLSCSGHRSQPQG